MARVEAALWTAINTLEERASTFHRLAVLHTGSTDLSSRYEDRSAQTLGQAHVLRDLLHSLLQAGDVG